MKITSFFLIFALCILAPNPGLFAQKNKQIKLHGLVLDSIGNNPLPLTSISNENSSITTLSNDSGAFEISAEKLPVMLSISYVGYRPQKIKITDTAKIIVKLSPLTIKLNTVVVSGNNALELLRKALEKALPYAAKKYYGKGYISQFTKEGDAYTGLQQAIFNGQWQSFAMTGWQPLQSRYASLEKTTISFKNFSFFSFMATGYLPSNVIHTPINKKPDSLYSCVINQYITGSNGHEIAVVECTPKNSKSTNIFSGKVYIDTENYDVLKMDGNIVNFSFDLSGPLSLKDTQVNTTIVFKSAPDGACVLDFADIKFTSKASLGFVTAKKLFYSAKILMFDYDNALSNEKYMVITPKMLDAEIMKSTPYESKVWENKDLILPTWSEKEAIRSFENKKLISNYLR